MAVTLDSAGLYITGIQLALPLPFDLNVAGCKPNDALKAELEVSGWGVHAFVRRSSAPERWEEGAILPDGTVLFTCRIEIPADARASTYLLSLSSLLVQRDDSARRVPAKSADGAIVIRD